MARTSPYRLYKVLANKGKKKFFFFPHLFLLSCAICKKKMSFQLRDSECETIRRVLDWGGTCSTEIVRQLRLAFAQFPQIAAYEPCGFVGAGANGVVLRVARRSSPRAVMQQSKGSSSPSGSGKSKEGQGTMIGAAGGGNGGGSSGSGGGGGGENRLVATGPAGNNGSGLPATMVMKLFRVGRGEGLAQQDFARHDLAPRVWFMGRLERFPFIEARTISGPSSSIICAGCGLNHGTIVGALLPMQPLLARGPSTTTTTAMATVANNNNGNVSNDTPSNKAQLLSRFVNTPMPRQLQPQLSSQQQIATLRPMQQQQATPQYAFQQQYQHQDGAAMSAIHLLPPPPPPPTLLPATIPAIPTAGTDAPLTATTNNVPNPNDPTINANNATCNSATCRHHHRNATKASATTMLTPVPIMQPPPLPLYQQQPFPVKQRPLNLIGMEAVDTTLERLLNKRRYSSAVIEAAVYKVIRMVDFAYSQGMTHGDVHWDNVGIQFRNDWKPQRGIATTAPLPAGFPSDLMNSSKAKRSKGDSLMMTSSSSSSSTASSSSVSSVMSFSSATTSSGSASLGSTSGKRNTVPQQASMSYVSPTRLTPEEAASRDAHRLAHSDFVFLDFGEATIFGRGRDTFPVLLDLLQLLRNARLDTYMYPREKMTQAMFEDLTRNWQRVYDIVAHEIYRRFPSVDISSRKKVSDLYKEQRDKYDAFVR